MWKWTKKKYIKKYPFFIAVIDKICDKGEDNTAQSSMLYNSYLKHGSKMSQNMFTHTMKKIGYESKKISVTLFIGISIKKEYVVANVVDDTNPKYDDFKKIIDTICNKDEDNTVQSSVLYNLYLKNSPTKITQIVFTQTMNKIGYESKKTKQNTVFLGVSIKK